MAAAPSGGAAGHRQQVDHFRDGIQSYLESLSMHTFPRLFMSPATCLAMFRLLPSLAKQLVMSMLYVDNAPSAEDVKQWCLPAAQRKRAEELARLEHVHIVTEQDSRLLLNPTFRTELRNALTGGGKLSSFGMRCSTPEPNPVDIAFLDAYAVAQSEAILHFMVGSSSSRRPSAGVINLMKRSRLMAQTGEGELSITNKGFQFLLQDANTQVWAFLLQYLDTAEELQMDVVEVLHFLFQLGSMELGVVTKLPAILPNKISDHVDLGQFRRAQRCRVFSLERGGGAAPRRRNRGTGCGAERERVHHCGDELPGVRLHGLAAADSGPEPFRVAVRAVREHGCRHHHPRERAERFSQGNHRRADNRLPHSARTPADAEKVGSSARTQDPLLPLTVVDQIRLWEMERNRLQCQPGMPSRGSSLKQNCFPPSPSHPTPHSYVLFARLKFFNMAVGILGTSWWSTSFSKRLTLCHP
ncbi:MAG: transcription factor Tfb2-domain-containing protein, partial [Olpidium bornovanus]